VQNPVTPWTNGLRVDSPCAAKLAYNYLEADGSANVNGAEGAVAFWFSPDWNGGTGPGGPGYLFELGDVTAPGGGWALLTDPAGTGLSFISGSNAVLTTNCTAPISGWVSNQWHQVVLSYSFAETLIFLDDTLAAGGPGLTFEPDLVTLLTDGFTVGSDHNGTNEARGVIDELTTYNCPLDRAVTTGGIGALLGTNGGLLSTNGGLVNIGQMNSIITPDNGLSSINGLEVFTPLK
jgi:hypothetical protein